MSDRSSNYWGDRLAVRRLTVVAVLGFVSSACALYDDVSIGPLLIQPTDINRASNIASEHVAIGDYPSAIRMAPSIDAKPTPAMKELKALGRAELLSGRLDDARRHLLAALKSKPYRTDYAEICWDLSQVESAAKNFGQAHSWALEAVDYGLGIKSWHVSLLENLDSEALPIHRIEGESEISVPIAHRGPEIPRVETRVNDSRVMGIIDSGAAMTILSDRLAAEAKLRWLGDFKGEFFGLLNEPIEVRFAMIDSLRIGDMTIRSVPVAVMSGEKMKFLTLNKTPFHIDLLLGASLLRDFRLEFDFAESRLSMKHLKEADKKPADNQNMFFLQGKPHAHGTINGKGWYLLVIDTGSEVTYLNSAEINRAQVAKNFAKVYRGAELQGLGGSTKRGIKVENIGVGIDVWEGVFKNLPLYSSPNSDAMGLVGENFFRNFRVVLDFGTMRMELERTSYGS